MPNPSDPSAAQFGPLAPTNPLADGAYADTVVQDQVMLTETGWTSGAVTRSSGEGERDWLAEKAATGVAATDAIFAAGDSNKITDFYRYAGLNLQRVSYSRLGPETWKLTCSYDDSPLVGGIKVSISTTGATIKQYQANNERVYPATGSNARWFRGAINVQTQGDELVPSGADIVIPTLRINVSGRIAYEYVDTEFEYSKKLAALTGTVNQNTEFAKPDGIGGFVSGTGFAPGELLFLGADGDIIADKDPLLTFSFLASPNLDAVTIGGIPSVTKKGHEFGWFSFKRALDNLAGPTTDGAAGGNSSRSVVIVDGYHVNTLYAGADWDDLALSKQPT